MIKLVFIVPYEELRPLVEQVLREYNADEEIITSIHVLKSWEIKGMTFHGDVIISRGFSAQIIREQQPELVCVPLQVSGYDMVRAVHKAVNLHNPRKIAVIDSYLMVYNAETLNAIFDVEIKTYFADSHDKIPDVIAQAKRDGCDCFVGGVSAFFSCDKSDAAVLIETGKSTIIQSMDEAVRLTRRTRIERNRAVWLHTIIDHSKEGVVFLDDKGSISAINNMAKHYLQAQDNWIGRSGQDMLPFARPFLEEVNKTGRVIDSEVFTLDGRLLTVDFIPTVHNQRTIGTILFIQSVNRLQKEESLIRKKIHSKGLKAKYTFDDILCTSSVFERTLNQAKVFSQVDSPILIVGESGTGKELLAQSIHNASPRRDGPFVAINCAALPENLLESELFGYSEGAFTGALKGGKAGLFETAHGGSIFLDEISEIPISFQSKLLRVLQENEVRRIGDDKVIPIDTHVIAATNRNLHEQVRKGLFRQDLLFRLNVLKLSIPPLRERPTDIINLFELYMLEFARKYQKNAVPISGEAKLLLEQYRWEGNVRELRNIAERICVLNSGGQVDAGIVREILCDDNPDALSCGQPMQTDAGQLQEILTEEETIRMLLQRYAGHKGKVAEHMNIDRSTLWRKMRKYRLLS